MLASVFLVPRNLGSSEIGAVFSRFRQHAVSLSLWFSLSDSGRWSGVTIVVRIQIVVPEFVCLSNPLTSHTSILRRSNNLRTCSPVCLISHIFVSHVSYICVCTYICVFLGVYYVHLFDICNCLYIVLSFDRHSTDTFRYYNTSIAIRSCRNAAAFYDYTIFY